MVAVSRPHIYRRVLPSVRALVFLQTVQSKGHSVRTFKSNIEVNAWDAAIDIDRESPSNSEAPISFGKQVHVTTTTDTRVAMTGNLADPDTTISDIASQPEECSHLVTRTSTTLSHSNVFQPAGFTDAPADMTKSSSSADGGAVADEVVRQKVSQLLKEREREWTAVVQKKGPLRLLDLPMDVLKEIMKEVSFTSIMLTIVSGHD